MLVSSTTVSNILNFQVRGMFTAASTRTKRRRQQRPGSCETGPKAGPGRDLNFRVKEGSNTGNSKDSDLSFSIGEEAVGE